MAPAVHAATTPMAENRPALRHHYRMEVVAGEGVMLLADEGSSWFRGRVYELLLPLLGHGRSTAELVAQLKDRVTEAEVHYALGRLEAGGCLAPPTDLPTATAESRYWHASGHHARAAAKWVSDLTVEVVAHDGADAAPFEAALRAAGLRLAPAASLQLVVCQDFLDPRLPARNATALADGTPWILVRATGRQPWVSPVFRPGAGPCWECCAARIRDNRGEEAVLRRLLDAPSAGWPALGSTGHSVAWAASTVAARLAEAAADGALRQDPDSGETRDMLLVLDAGAMAIEHHPITRRPQCPACGEPTLVASNQTRPIRLVSTAARFTRDGGHRSETPSAVVERFLGQVSPLTGVVPRLAPIEPGIGEERVTPLFDAGHNPARRDGSIHLLIQNFRHRSVGKGRTVAQARASALCEALERYSGVYRGDESRRLARIDELDAPAVLPSHLQLFSDSQLDERDAWNARHPNRFHAVPPCFDPSRASDWSPAWSLTHDARRWLPTALCFYDYRESDMPFFGWADSNGCAAGSNLTEAVLHGFLELVERDAVALWWYNRAARPAVDLAGLSDPYISDVQRLYERMNRSVWVLDLMTDLGIPVFAALSRNEGEGPEAITFGFGAHLDPAVGISRAITEMHQFLPFLEHFLRQGLPEDTDAGRWLGRATLGSDPHLAANAGRAPQPLSSYDRLCSGDLARDVQRCVSAADRAGLETIVLDQTRPDVGLSVARVVVPGLRHFWPRFGAGRLFEVPVELGWIESPLAEADLNPEAVFF